MPSAAVSVLTLILVLIAVLILVVVLVAVLILAVVLILILVIHALFLPKRSGGIAAYLG